MRQRRKAARLVPAGPSAAALGAAVLSTLLVSTQALAYCRTTTCVDGEINCRVDDDKCSLEGMPLWWPDRCVTFGVHAEGSPLRGVSFKQANRVATKAFQTWISADCGNSGRPSIAVTAKGKVYCNQVEYYHEPPAPNANIITFRDGAWPYLDDTDTIALTTITFEKRTGAILDADIEVNSKDIELTTGNSDIKGDLQSILTHEIGHFFGLAHSTDADASMNPFYDLEGATFRSLSPDDRSGICSIYPPNAVELGSCKGEEPRYGFSRYCGQPEDQATGCSVSTWEPSPPRTELDETPSRESRGLGTLAMVAGALGLGLSLRRRRRQA